MSPTTEEEDSARHTAARSGGSRAPCLFCRHRPRPVLATLATKRTHEPIEFSWFARPCRIVISHSWSADCDI